MLPDMIPWYLIQGIALVQLYLEERFVEPPKTDRLPYSLLYPPDDEYAGLLRGDGPRRSLPRAC